MLVDTHHNPHDGLHAYDVIEIEKAKLKKKEDQVLKARIRRLRLISRILAFLVSIAVFIPITLTLHKFLTTKDTFREAPGKNGATVNRNPWAKDSKTWPTYMYFAVAATALVLNMVILVSYKFGIKNANRAASISTFFTWIVMIGNLVVWSIAASLYRSEKNKNGKSNDLWGWTCSAAAREIQHVFHDDVNFNKFCKTQSISFYAGLVQVGLGLLTIITYLMVIRRRKVKKTVEDKARLLGDHDVWDASH
ncbi:uncharacterized protein BDZ99DRAFT_459647 [Mytilinidion resinicola]|uniref:MARVEL domain-containing protein n=1 Tax=Mytilinidion resinicola TaxID=574789 RepID=A0A6A6YZC9_9PEZI|nr:uncharacterized protein BDZ99DRAFT_459647 [Mytilinidion resinicola]KAF2813898.1 hypothetical protein BDZ99DRAFT_459647 [Mytilinidion resinicola]